MICFTALGQGDWTASLSDKATGAELPLERHEWRGDAGRARNQVSEATLVLDAGYARWLGLRPVLWNNELVLYRDGRLEWVGPVTSIDDATDGTVTWNAQDRMALPMSRRWFWRDGNHTGDQTNLMTVALSQADHGDPTGLIRDARLTGVITSMNVRAGDKIGDAVDDLGIAWTVIGETVRYGEIDVITDRLLTVDAWGEDRPAISADGYERLSHVAAVTTNNGRVFYPSPDPDDRPPGTPLLVDTIDVGDVSAAQARQLARQAWLDRQGEISIIADESRPLTDQFPLAWSELEPGAVMRATAQGTQLTAINRPVRVSSTSAAIADGVESSIAANVDEATASDLSDPYLHDLADFPGVEFPDAAVYPLTDRAGIDWSAIDLLADSDFNVGGLPGPDIGLVPVDFSAIDSPIGIDGIDSPLIDPYANCPPEQCCDLCGSSGGGGAGSSGITVAAAALDFTNITGYAEAPLPGNAVNGAQLVMQLFIYHNNDHGPYPIPDVFTDSWTVHLHDQDAEVDAFPILPPDDTIGTIIVASRTWDGDVRTLQIDLGFNYDTVMFGQVICATGVGPVEAFDHVPLYIQDNVAPDPPEQGLYPIARPTVVTDNSLIISGWTKSLFTLSHDPNNDGTGCVLAGDANVPGYTNLYGLPYDAQLWAMYSDDLWPVGPIEQQQVYICANAFAQSIDFWAVALPQI